MKRLVIFFLSRLLGEYRRPSLYRWLLGVDIGENNRFTGVINFGSEPYLVKVGDNVTLAQGTTFVTHDGGVSLFRNDYPGLNVFGKITIGSNVFVGSGVTILPGVTIGDNVVIGACSLVAKSIPSGVVAAGVPARPIKSIDSYRNGALKKGVVLPPGIQGRREFIERALD